jgi:uncharacterized protein YcnI
MLKPLCATALAAVATTAHAHATLDPGEATVGSSYRAAVRVPHGCEGEATLKVRVRIPEGVIAVKPMPKAGWKLETVKGPYARPYEYFGTEMTEGVIEVIWTGELLDEHYDEFVFRGMITDTLEPGAMLYFPAVQECATKVERWIELPAEGQDPDVLEYPAPGIKLLPAAGGE